MRAARSPSSAYRLRLGVLRLAAGLVMLLAVMPHLTAMALPTGHWPAPAPHAGAASLPAAELPCHQKGDADPGIASDAICGSWNCGLIGAAPPPPESRQASRAGRRLAVVAQPLPARRTIEPGDRPPRPQVLRTL